MRPTIQLTKPQQNVLALVNTMGEAKKEDLIKAGLDIRAANNLVKRKLVTFSATGYYCSLPDSPPCETPHVLSDTDVPAPTELPPWTQEKTPYKGSAAAAAARVRVESAPRPAPKLRSKTCLCGCGEQVPGRFKQGHDMKLHSAVARSEGPFQATPAQAEWLATKPWAQGKYTATN